MKTLGDLFKTFKERGNATAFVYRTGVRRFVFSYRDLHVLSLRMARLLEERGVKKGDRVVLWAPNSPWWGIIFWGGGRARRDSGAGGFYVRQRTGGNHRETHRSETY